MNRRDAWSIPLFRFSGIQVYLHASWFILAFFRVPGLVGEDLTLPWAIALYVSLFVIVLMHEFGHALACRQTGGEVHDIVLWPLGGIAFVSPPPRPGATLWSIAAGPLVNVVLVPILFALVLLSRRLEWTDAIPGLAAYIRALNALNIGLLIFNLVPVFPLDGGQILQSVLWFWVGRIRSLQIAATIGLVAVAVFGVFAVSRGEIWLSLIALFLGQRCWIGLKEAKTLRALEQMPRHPGFSCPTCHAPPPGGPLWVCRNCGGRFDPFSTRAVCPHCQTQQATTMCAFCGSSHAIEAWQDTAPPIL